MQLATTQNKMARTLIPLVHQVAAQVARRLPSHVQMDDLVSAGMLGLAGALNRFDPERADTFRGYAEFRIRGQIMDELRRRDHMSRDARADSRRLQNVVEELRQLRGTEPEANEVADRLGISLDELRSLQLRAHDGATVSLSNITVGAPQRSPEDTAAVDQQRERLAIAIKKLSERRRVVLWLYYFEELPLKEIGDILDVTPSRVCQIRSEAVAALKKIMKG